MKNSIIKILLVVCVSTLFQACVFPEDSDSEETRATLPIIPEQFSATVYSANEVELVWVDDSSRDQGYEIERSENGAKFELITTADSIDRQFMDMGVSTGNTYSYRIRSYNSWGNSGYIESDSVLVRSIESCGQTSPNPGDASMATIFDIPISGLVYSSDNFYSVTDQDSRYLHDENPTSFFLGYIPVGASYNDEYIRLAGIVDSESAELMNTSTINFLRLMLVIDEDGDDSNGIQIPCEYSTLSGRIDFSLPEEQFSSQETVVALAAGLILPESAAIPAYYTETVRARFVGNYRVRISVLHDGIMPYSGDMIFTLNPNGQLVNLDVFEDFRHFAIDSIRFAPERSLTFEADLEGFILGLFAYFDKVELRGSITPDLSASGDASMTGSTTAPGSFSGGIEP